MRINHFVIKKNALYYEVQYDKKKPVDLLSSEAIQQQNPQLIVGFFERSLRALMREGSSK